MEIAPPLLGKFQSLVLDNRDLAGLARCLPPDSGSRSPSGGGGGDSGHQSPVGGAAVAAGVAGDGRSGAGDAQQQRERLRPDLLPLNVNDMNSGYYAGRIGSGGSGGGGDVGEHTLPLDSPSNNSLFSFGSSTSMAEEDEVGTGFGPIQNRQTDRQTNTDRSIVCLPLGEAGVGLCVVNLIVHHRYQASFRVLLLSDRLLYAKVIVDGVVCMYHNVWFLLGCVHFDFEQDPK